MLTSSYPLVRGSSVGASGDQGDEEDDLLLSPVSMPVSLQQQLGASGYTTIASVGGGYLIPALGFDAGFDWYLLPQHTPRLADQIAALERRLPMSDGRPFFLLLHTYDIHDYFHGRGDCLEHFDRGYQGPLRDPIRLREAIFESRSDSTLTAAELQYIVDLYDGEILHADQCLASFIDWVLTSAMGEDTIVVVTADHGEAFGERGKLMHGWAPYQEIVHVPLIMRLPDGRGGGRRVRQSVGLVDLAPTLLDLAGVGVPSGFVGRSLLPLIEGRAEEQAQPILSESPRFGLMARDGNWCYMVLRHAGREELYDLDTDPGQVKDLAARRRDQLSRMRRVLAELAMVAASGTRVVVAGERPDRTVLELQCDDALGYLDVPTLADEAKLERVGGWRPAGDPSASTSPETVRAIVELPAGDQPHVVLVAPQDPAGTVSLSASIGGRTVGVGRFHLGVTGISPEALPVRIRAGATSRLLSATPPVPAEPESWGIWAWQPRAVAPRPTRVLTGGELHPDMVENLRSLGYIR
jgi:hypothetical protein